MRRGRSHRCIVAAACVLLIGGLGSARGAEAAGSTAIIVDGAGSGRIFDGIGAISGGGGNSRLLIDYPEPQRSQILDYLFKPGYGASLQLLKIEIGGDTNSTDGAEPSHMHTASDLDCNRGYEWWLAEQARARNPEIKLYGLAWGAPGWIGGGDFWSQDMIDYLMRWMDCARSHGLSIDYLGGWNERGYDEAWYENLDATLAAKGYATKLVGADSGWGVADDIVSDPAFAAAVDIIGAHYPCEGGDGGSADSCSTTSNALASGKPLWASENGSLDYNTGSPALIRSITRGYVDARMTAYLNWPLLAAITPNLPYNSVGLAVANQPWSGAYSLGKSLWATAQVTQFTRPGWSFIDSASGFLGGDRANGSYVSLKSPNGSDWTTIVETTTAHDEQTADFTVTGGLSTATLHLWATDVGSWSGDAFVRLPDINPTAGRFSVTLKPGYVYTVSTTSGQGRGTASSPSPGRLALPYADDFDRYAVGKEARYLADMQGAFETVDCTGGRSGRCLRQMAPTKPIEWQDDSDAFALLGDVAWTDYTVSSDIYFAQPGTVELLGRANNQSRPQSHQAGYYLRVRDTGAWSISKNDTSAVRTTLASGTTSALPTTAWHKLALTFHGTTITAAIDGTTVGVVDDATYAAGQFGFGVVGYQTNEFDNLAITPVHGNVTPATVTVDAPAVINRGDTATVTGTFSVLEGAQQKKGVTLTLDAPAGWTVSPGAQTFGRVKAGRSVRAQWTVTAPTARDTPDSATFTVTANYAQGNVAHWARGTATVSVPVPAPTGTVFVSDLPFISATNGWGPVERDTSNGENQAGDGTTITLNGTQYAKGIGAHANGDVAVYLGGNCTRFTAVVGVDDEVDPYGTVKFTVTADGNALTTTPVLDNGSAPYPIDVGVTGAQQLDLIVNDTGDTNAHDHADWADAKLACAG